MFTEFFSDFLLFRVFGFFLFDVIAVFNESEFGEDDFFDAVFVKDGFEFNHECVEVLVVASLRAKEDTIEDVEEFERFDTRFAEFIFIFGECLE